ncbi:MAG: hypothetical protein B7Y84_11225 [Azorhizobium sp. 32-67-21]|nr:MAG: hypothetical protein B7Y84_11225 [Azorhizobium sp. 32-67-21]
MTHRKEPRATMALPCSWTVPVPYSPQSKGGVPRGRIIPDPVRGGGGWMRGWLSALRAYVSGRSRTWRFAALGVLCLLPLVIFAGIALADRAEHRRLAHRHLLGTVNALAEHAGTVFTAIDLALMQTEQALGEGPVSRSRSDLLFQQTLQGTLRRLPALESLFLVDEAGTVSASSRSFPMPPYDVQHRDYFQSARSGEDGLFVSVPFRGEFARSVAFTVSRRLVAPDGTFRGLVAATVFPEYFQSLYRGAFLTREATVALVRADGTQILRFPDTRASDAGAVAADFAAGAVRQTSGLVFGRGLVDATSDTVAFRALTNVPLVFVHAVREQDLLEPWVRRLAGYGVLAAASSVLMGLGAGLVLFRLSPGPAGAEVCSPAAATPVQRPLEYHNRGAVQVLDAVRSSLGLMRREGEETGAASPFLPRPRDVLDGAVHGLTLAQRLISAASRDRPDARIVNARASLQSLSQLLCGSLWPPLEVVREAGAEQLDVFVEPAAFDLALFELAVAIKQVLPPGIPLRVVATRKVLRLSHPDGLAPGDYVSLAFEAGSAATPGGPAQEQQARLRFVARFAHRSEGALILPAGEIVAGGTLMLPAALVAREPKVD